MRFSEINRAFKRLQLKFTTFIENASTAGRSKKQLVVAGVDGVLVCAALWLAYSLRQGVPFTDFKGSWHLFVLMPILTFVTFTGLGIYKWVLRTSNERLLLLIVKGGMISSGLLLTILFLFPPETTPRSLFVIYGMIFVLSASTVRLVWQALFRTGSSPSNRAPIAIYGAGNAGQQLAGLMRFDANHVPVCFIDDNPALWRTTIAGLPVLSGKTNEILSAVSRYSLARIVLAVPSIKGAAYTAIVDKLSDIPVPVQTIPSIKEIMSGAASPDQFRDLSIADLLGRTEVEPDSGLLGQCVNDKVVLVTGGGGSIGSEICRQIMQLSPRKLIVFDHGEENLYKISEELELLEKDRSEFVPILGSVTNKRKVFEVIRQHRVDTVYHAAAYKHVPIVENNPEEAIEVNVFGTRNVLDASIENGVKNFTLISTDKAVRPANYMGASKRFAELILQAKADLNHNTTICMVRFGNVLGSSGSVVPKFKRQIQEGGPITLTHPDITRYFMTIPEASQLVLQASALAEGGEVFVLDMGEPIRIIDLARSMIQLSGKKLKTEDSPEGDIGIKIEGLRPGEKMYEELFIGDSFDKTIISKIFVTYEDYVSWDELQDSLFELQAAHSDQSDYLESLKKIMRLVGLHQVADQEQGKDKYQRETVIPVASAPTSSEIGRLIDDNRQQIVSST